MEFLGESYLENEILLTEVPVVEVEEKTAVEPTFTHESATVHLKFSKNGKTLDDLLINYFKNLKQR